MVKFICEDIWPRAFFWGKFSDYCFNFIRCCNLSIQILRFFLIYLENCMFLRIYPFRSGCPIYWHIIVHDIFLQSFVFLWCQLLFLLFHFWFYLFGSFLSFSWWVWLKICQSCLSFQRISSWIHWSFVFISDYFIYFCSDLYYFLPCTHFGLCFSFSSFFKCEVRLFIWTLSCLFEIGL